MASSDPAQEKSSLSFRGHYAKKLTEEEYEKLGNSSSLVSTFQQLKLEREAKKNWDIFYKRNTDKFFKDRHWTTREYEELTQCGKEGGRVSVLEVGCGVGNFVIPLLDINPHLYFHACDFSPRAIQLLKAKPEVDASRLNAFVCDITRDALTLNIPPRSLDIVTVIFVLSALLPESMPAALDNIMKVLRPGGVVLLRDYGLYDHAMLRFAARQKLAANLYVRQDGTRSYFFSQEFTESLFNKAGFETIENKYVNRDTINKKEDIHVIRVFIQSKFRKPLDSSATDDSEGKSKDSCGVTVGDSCGVTAHGDSLMLTRESSSDAKHSDSLKVTGAAGIAYDESEGPVRSDNSVLTESATTAADKETDDSLVVISDTGVKDS